MTEDWCESCRDMRMKVDVRTVIIRYLVAINLATITVCTSVVIFVAQR